MVEFYKDSTALEIKVALEADAIMPKKAHDKDAGYDLYAREDAIVLPKSHAEFDTGVHVSIPDGYFGLVISKSGLNFKHGITSRGVIDAPYRGSIGVRLENHSDEPYEVYAGDKISQLVIIPIPDVELVEVDELDVTERNGCGFGSTGR